MDNSVLTIANLFTMILSTIASLGALYVAWDCRKKTTQHIVNIIASATEHKTGPRNFHEFYIIVKNYGLPTPKMAFALTFRQKDGLAMQNANLQAIDIVTGEVTDTANNVACGMILKFGFASDKMQDYQKGFLTGLQDFQKQNATLRAYCAGFQVQDFKLYSWSQRLKAIRDRIVERLNRILPASCQIDFTPPVGYTLEHFITTIKDEAQFSKLHGG